MVYKTRGFGGFYIGWQPKMIQYIIQSVFTVSILDKLENKIQGIPVV